MARRIPRLRPLVGGVERADSWTTDAHKWLNVPYDSGLVFCAHPEAHRAAMAVTASYLIQDEGARAVRDQMDWVPEFSRRARGFAVYAALRSLGRAGVAELVDRCCACARERRANGLDPAARASRRLGLDERHHVEQSEGDPGLGQQLADRRG
jgi:glutamate/tyrosine decarboxylase-like PLP-dependent enzyme